MKEKTRREWKSEQMGKECEVGWSKKKMVASWEMVWVRGRTITQETRKQHGHTSGRGWVRAPEGIAKYIGFRFYIFAPTFELSWTIENNFHTYIFFSLLLPDTLKNWKQTCRELYFALFLSLFLEIFGTRASLKCRLMWSFVLDGREVSKFEQMASSEMRKTNGSTRFNYPNLSWSQMSHSYTYYLVVRPRYS